MSSNTKVINLIPEINAQTPFTTATIACNDFQLFNLEGAIMNGPLLVMTEYMGQPYSRPTHG